MMQSPIQESEVEMEVTDPTEPHVRLVEITPERAERWLSSSNTHNRRMNRAEISRMARDMQAGRFKLTHQGIAFSKEGVLIDGQNRLAAIILAKVPVKMHVWYMMPMETQEFTDGHSPRLANEVLTLSNRFGQVTKRDIAILRTLVLGLKFRQKYSVAEEADQFEKHKEAIEFAVQHTPPRTRGVFTATTAAVIARAWYTADREKLIRFCKVLHEPGAMAEGEGAAVLLWALLAKGGIGQGARRKDRYAKTERALEAFLKGERPEKLYAAKQELFPLPGELPPAAAVA